MRKVFSNIKLDRIWSNLLYRNPLIWVKDKNENIIDVKFSEEDIDKKNFLDKRILEAKKEMSDARKSGGENYERTKNLACVIDTWSFVLFYFCV